jgi:glycine/D-amino acid oxidase-like deaminating enzyme
MNLDPFRDAQFTPWWWEWAPRATRTKEHLPKRAEIAIVGSGFTGLVAALQLARAGRDVVVLEADTIGYGASSRNGGQVGSGNQRFTVARLIELYGKDQAQALLQEGISALSYIKALIAAEDIQCHYREAGRFRGASRPRHYDNLARDMDDLHTFAGVESYMVPQAELDSEIGTSLYYGGAVLPRDASLHPALYHSGLLDRAESAGVRVFSHARVKGVQEKGQKLQITSARGVLSADKVLIATNGYSDRSMPYFYRRVVPVASAIIATTELSPDLMTRLMPKKRVFGDTRRVHHYYQSSPDGLRILMGGRLAGRADTTRPRDFFHLYRHMLEIFPELAGVGISHAWSGYVGFTRDTFPHINKQGSMYSAMGYCGSGVARASYAGYKVAHQILESPGSATAWNKLVFKTIPFRSFARTGVQIATQWKRVRDAL